MPGSKFEEGAVRGSEDEEVLLAAHSNRLFVLLSIWVE